MISNSKVRDFITLKPYSGVYTVDLLSPENVIQSYLFTNESISNFNTLLAELSKPVGTDRRAIFLCGDRGVGKTHSLAVLREVLASPGLADKLDPALRQRMASIRKKKLIIVDIQCFPNQEENLREIFYHRFTDAISGFTSAEIPPMEEWQELSDSDEQVKFITDLIPAGFELLILMDDISEKILSHRNLAKVMVDLEFLLTLALATPDYPLYLVSTFFQHLLSPPDYTNRYNSLYNKIVEYQLPNHILMVTISKKNILELVNRNILIKTAQQKESLRKIHQHLTRSLPTFDHDAELFQDIYPIHPVTFQISFYLHRYIKNFSLMSFIYSTANKILTYRCTSLATIDLIFDTLHHEFRKIDDLRIALESFNTIQKQTIDTMPVSQRLMARMILKAVFLLSITEEFTPSIENVINALLLSEYQGRPVTAGDVESILDYMVEHAPESIRKQTSDGRSVYQIVSATFTSLEHVLKDLGAKEQKLVEKRERMVFQASCRLLPDLQINEENIKAPISVQPLELPWRGTARQGLACWAEFYDQLHVSPLERQPRSMFQVILESGDLDKMKKLAQVIPPPPLPSAVSGYSPHARNEYLDWQIMVLSPFPSEDLVETYASLSRHYPFLVIVAPAPFTAEELDRLAQTTLLLADENRAIFAENDLDEEYHQRREREEQFLKDILTRKYLQEGALILKGDTIPLHNATPDNLLSEVISGHLRDAFDHLFPAHPDFEVQPVLEGRRGIIVRYLLSGTIENESEQQVIDNILQPLGLLTPDDNGQLSFQPDRDSFLELGFISDIICLVTSYPKTVFPLSFFRNVLAQSPYGFPSSVIDIILFSVVAAGKIKIFKSDRAEVEVVNQMSLSGEIDLNFFDSVQAMEGETLPLPELLQWGFTLCAQELEGTTSNITQTRRQLRGLLQEWLATEKQQSFDDLLEQLANDLVTTHLWRELQSCYRNASAIKNIVDNICSGEYGLEEGLSLLARAFSNNLEAFRSVLQEIDNIRDYLRWNRFFIEAKKYVLISEKTPDQNIENLRYDLSSSFERPARLIDPVRRERYQNNFNEFKERYIRFYREKHDAQLQEIWNDSDLGEFVRQRWWKNLPYFSKLMFVDHYHLIILNHLLSVLHRKECHFPVEELLQHTPVCECGFRLSSTQTPSHLAKRIIQTAKQAASDYQTFFANYKKLIIREMQKIPSLEDETARQVINLINGNFDYVINTDAIKLVNFILKRRVKTCGHQQVYGELPGAIVARSDLMHSLARFFKEIEESKEMYFMITEKET
jgi:hypothetical protein